jgi:hypothetical protein
VFIIEKTVGNANIIDIKDEFGYIEHGYFEYHGYVEVI